MASDPQSGDLLAFYNRLTIRAGNSDGFALYQSRIERGTFVFPTADRHDSTVTPAQLAMILDGLDFTTATSCNRFHHYSGLFVVPFISRWSTTR